MITPRKMPFLPVNVSPASITFLYVITGMVLLFTMRSIPVRSIFPNRVLQLAATPGLLLPLFITAIPLYLFLTRYRRNVNELYQAMFISAPNAICVYRQDDFSLLRGNDKFARIFDYPDSSPDAEAASPNALWSFEEDRENFRELLANLGEVNEFDTIFSTSTGTLLNVTLYGKTIRLDGEPCIWVTIHDISRLIKAKEQIKQLTRFDEETGLPNLTALIERMKQIVELNSRECRATAVMYINLNNYRLINDIYGDNVAKETVRHFSRQLSDVLRKTDTLARISRDNFVIVLSGNLSETDIATVLFKIITICDHPLTVAEEEIAITASIGVACFPQDGLDEGTLLRNAHKAMIQAHTLPNGYRFFSENLNSSITERLRIEKNMVRGLANNEFFLCYQPRFGANGKDMTGMEALARWNQPEIGAVSPQHFIPIAEENGFIVPLGEWILLEACRQTKQWQDEGHAWLRVSVNISLRQLREKNFVERVTEIVRQSGLDPSYLELELTESVIMSDPDNTIMKLMRLKELGITLAVDDFGTGYSSLSYLKHLPVDIIKIDRMFVTDISKDPDDESIVRAIISLAHSLKMKVVAEGVETKQQMNFLRQERCNEFQGYLFARPLTPEAFSSMLKDTGKRRATSQTGAKHVAATVDGAPPFHEMTPIPFNTYGTDVTAGAGPGESRQSVGDNVLAVEPVSSLTILPNILNRFQSDKNLLILPVVDNGKVVGIVNRLTFLEEHVIGRYGFGYHINHSRKIRELMAPPEICIDAEARIDEAAYIIQSLKPEARIEFICITRNGLYEGLLDVNRFVSAMSERNLALAKGANPLTGLPGNEAIQREISERIDSELPFEIAYIDIDNFKPYNDCYGFQRGDTVIKSLADIIRGAVSGHSSHERCFFGHIGGDDYILISEAGCALDIAATIIREFEKRLPHFHGEKDFNAACYYSVNRKAEAECFALLSISIGVLNTRNTPVASYSQLASLSTVVKKAAKQRSGSSLVFFHEIENNRAGLDEYIKPAGPLQEAVGM